VTDPGLAKAPGGTGIPASDRLLALFLRVPLIVLATILLGTISLAGSFFDSRGRFQHRCARLWGRLLLAVAGVRLEVRGLEAFRASGPRILCANHQSDMDIPVLLAALPFELRFTAKKSLFRLPFLGWHLRRAGHVRIDRENPRAALRALDGTVPRIREGLPVVVFPEGKISQDGRMGEFRRGAFLLAERSGADLVPVTIRGTRGILAPGSWTVRGGRVRVTIGPAVASHTMPAERLRSVIRERVARGRVHSE
jgi:1-acyl-sn-glycerol-3-phosphate acyltransferase